MSLAIDIDRVAAVLLNDGWHNVAWHTDGKSSFDLDSYEIGTSWHKNRPRILNDGGPGFFFISDDTGQRIMGPFSSLLALVERPLTEEEQLEEALR